MKMDIEGKGHQGNKSAPPKPQNTLATVKRLLGYMKKSSFLIIISLFIALTGTIMQVINPKILGFATTEIFTGLTSAQGINFNILFKILITAGLIYGGIFVTSFLQEWVMTIVSQKMTKVLRSELKAKMDKVPIKFFDKNANGDLMSVASNDIDNIAVNLQTGLTQLISSAVLITGTLAMMFYISPVLSLLALFMIPASLVIGKIFTPISQKNNKKYFKSMGEINSRIEEAYEGFTVVKSFNGEKKAVEIFEKANEEMYESGWKAKFFGSSMMHCMMLCQNIIYVSIAAFGAVRVMTGTILIGDLQAFIQYSQQFSSPIAKLGQVWSNLLSVVASAERVFDILDREEIQSQKAGYETIKADRAKIVFDNVTFGYEDETLMKNFDIEVHEGEMIAIVGHTGAGKTTLVNLLERFYEIDGGSIRIDGRDIRGMEDSELRKGIAMVLQDTWLFSGTIFDNIKYGNENASDEEVYEAAKAAYAHEFITKLPEGYNTVLGEEAGNISQGQKQLITIARAFVKNPEILILDEATSNVDSRTEMVIQKAMGRLLQGRTSFVVAHRLSTIYDASRIVVMEKGDIVEMGTHRVLVNKNGKYAEIYNSQFAQAINKSA